MSNQTCLQVLKSHEADLASELILEMVDFLGGRKFEFCLFFLCNRWVRIVDPQFLRGLTVRLPSHCSHEALCDGGCAGGAGTGDHSL